MIRMRMIASNERSLGLSIYLASFLGLCVFVAIALLRFSGTMPSTSRELALPLAAALAQFNIANQLAPRPDGISGAPVHEVANALSFRPDPASSGGFPSKPAIIALGIISLLGIISAISIWYWSKSGVILHLVLASLAAGIGLAMGTTQVLFALMGPVLLLVLIAPYWDRMLWTPYGTMWD